MDKFDNVEDEIKQAIIKKAKGYEYEEKEVIADKNGRPGKVKITKKYMPPDLAAIKTIKRFIDTGRW